MNQFDVSKNPEHGRQPNVPLLVSVQSNYFLKARTLVVIPLVKSIAPSVATALNPSFVVAEQTVCLDPFQMAFVPVRILGQPVASLADRRDEIIRAIDALLSGL